MNYCQAHWDQLRTAIDAQGLGHLVTPSGSQVLTDTLAEFRGGDKAPFDPLIHACSLVLGRAMRVFGRALFTPDEQGALRCPVCMLLTMPDPQGRDRAGLEQHYAHDLAVHCAAVARENGVLPDA